MSSLEMRSVMSSKTVWTILAIAFCSTILMDFYIFAPKGSAISIFFAGRHVLLRLLTYVFCLFVMLIIPHCLISDMPVKNKVIWVILFFCTSFLATEVYFVVRTISGWETNTRG